MRDEDVEEDGRDADVQDVLRRFRRQHPLPSIEALEEWQARHPQFAAELLGQAATSIRRALSTEDQGGPSS